MVNKLLYMFSRERPSPIPINDNRDEDATHRLLSFLLKILFPLVPEHIGYCDVGIADDLFLSYMPHIEHVDNHIFKYHIDLDRIETADEVKKAYCKAT